jgi:hypothetical protein
MIEIKLNSVTARTNSSGVSGILTGVDFDLVKIDGIKVSSINQKIRLNNPNFESFIEADLVSKSQLIEWVKNQLGDDRLKRAEEVLDEKMAREYDIDISKLK